MIPKMITLSMVNFGKLISSTLTLMSNEMDLTKNAL